MRDTAGLGMPDGIFFLVVLVKLDSLAGAIC
jgi:hypothetical protein